MSERLQKLGGHLDIESAPGKGTQVTGVSPMGEAFGERGEKA
jgi:signal transduction histidine kinase